MNKKQENLNELLSKQNKNEGKHKVEEKHEVEKPVHQKLQK